MAEQRIFYDTFTEASTDTNLDSHTPDTGTGWTNIYTNGSAPVATIMADAANDQAEPSALDADAGRGYSADATYNQADYQVSCTSTAAGSSGANPSYLLARIDSTGANGYWAEFKGPVAGTATNVLLGKIVSSSFTILVTHDNSTLSGSISPNGGARILQVVGTDITYYSANANETAGEVAHLYASDSAVSAANKGGLGMGAYRTLADDMNAGFTPLLDEFEVWETGASTAGWSSPTTTGEVNNDFTNPTNAYASDGSDATTTTLAHKQDYGDFGFSIAAGSTIRGIMVKIEGDTVSARWGRWGVRVSNDNGATWSAQKLIEFEGTGDITKVVGHARSLWGLSWTATDLNDTDFRVQLEYVAEESTLATLNVDHIQVKVVYDAPAGGTVVSDPFAFGVVPYAR